MVDPDPIPRSREALLPQGPAALIVAHPGHEMRVHAWLCRARPEVFVLTDGSGHRDRGRIDSTGRVLAASGAQRGSIFGRLADRRAYELILTRQLDELKRLVVELADGLERRRVRYVLSDAVEGLNPVHDLCYVMTAAALARASARLVASGAEPIDHYNFLLDAEPAARVGQDREAVQMRLSDAELRRKLDEARDYVALRPEVDSALEAWGEEAFRFEVVYPASPDRSLEDMVGERPRYESFGARRVEQGVYSELLRFRQHFEPVATALLAWSRG